MAIAVAIVEDDAEVRETLSGLVHRSPGFRCTGAYGSAEKALRELPEDKPEVVLMDIQLPKMSGIDCVRRLKPQLPNTQFIMLTVFEDTNRIFAALSAGATGYLLKQSSPSELLAAITEVHQGGSPMSSDIARKVVISFQQSDGAAQQCQDLTDREREILGYLAKGYLYKEISDALGISFDTVHTHIRHIYEKLQVRTRTEAVAKYLQS